MHLTQSEMRRELEIIFNTPQGEIFKDEEGLKYLYDLYLMKLNLKPIRKKQTRLKVKKEFWETRKQRDFFDLGFLMDKMLLKKGSNNYFNKYK